MSTKLKTFRNEESVSVIENTIYVLYNANFSVKCRKISIRTQFKLEGGTEGEFERENKNFFNVFFLAPNP